MLFGKEALKIIRNMLTAGYVQEARNVRTAKTMNEYKEAGIDKVAIPNNDAITTKTTDSEVKLRAFNLCSRFGHYDLN